MQNLSSKKNEQLLRASELFDGQCHQLHEDDSILMADAEIKQHMRNWALIGSALRKEMPAKIDLNFADKVMARVHNEEPQVCANDDLPLFLQSKEAFAHAQNMQMQEPIQLPVKKHSSFKRVFIFTSQIAIAASVALFAIVGLQTYNAAKPTSEAPIASAESNGSPISGLNLASYQNDSSDIMNLDQLSKKKLDPANNQTSPDVAMKQKAEVDRINSYVKGYVLDTAQD